MDVHQDIHQVSITENETLIDLSSGQNGIVLVFIPDTHGISSRIQLKNLRNDYHKISNLGWSIVIITSEEVEDFSKSSDALSLPFPIKHDEENKLAASFNTLGTKFSNPYISERTKRRTYILNQDLHTLHVIDNIHPEYHSDEIIGLLEKATIEISDSSLHKHETVPSEK